MCTFLALAVAISWMISSKFNDLRISLSILNRDKAVRWSWFMVDHKKLLTLFRRENERSPLQLLIISDKCSRNAVSTFGETFDHVGFNYNAVHIDSLAFVTFLLNIWGRKSNKLLKFLGEIYWSIIWVFVTQIFLWNKISNNIVNKIEVPKKNWGPKAMALLSPATKWNGDIGLGAVRPSVIPFVCPEIVSGA